MRVYVAQLNPIVGALDYNTDKIIHHIQRARQQKSDIAVFPEMAICGYPPEDLVLFPDFIEKMEQKLELIIQASKDIMVVVGLVRKNPTGAGKFLYNSAAVIIDQELVGYKDKTLLPTYDVFDESRYFEPGEEQKVFTYKNNTVAVMICEDVWQHSKKLTHTRYKRDPIQEVASQNPSLLLNISASPYYFQKTNERMKVLSPCAKTLNCPLIWCNQIGGNDSLVFDGYSLFINESGELNFIGKGFKEDAFIIDLKRKKPAISILESSLEDLHKALVLGVKDYFQKQGFTKAVIGLSGGVDSALVTCIAQEALGYKNIKTVFMPSRFSSIESMEDARALSHNLNIPIQEIPIDLIFQKYLDLLSPLFQGCAFDVTEENIQARIRGMILMAISNKFGYLVLSTGNKSEMAVGYSTLYGDMCGGLGVINDVSKTKVYQLCQWINNRKEVIPKRILVKPPSAELRANQTDQDTLPDYDLLDKVLSEYVEGHLPIQTIAEKYDLSKKFVQDLVHKIHLAEYKRRQSPLGIRVTKKAFSKGRIFPIVQKWA